MKRHLCGLSLLFGLLPAQAIEFTIGSDLGDTQFHQPGATAVGQVFIFPRSGFETSFLIDGITFWGKAAPSTVQFKLGYVNGDQFFEGYSSSYTFGAGGGDGQFETIHFDLPNLRFPSGYYVLGYFTGLPENASFRLNSWSSDAYTSELNYLALYNAGDPTCSIYYQQNEVWAHDPNDLGFLAQLTGTYTGDMRSNKETPHRRLPAGGAALAGLSDLWGFAADRGARWWGVRDTAVSITRTPQRFAPQREERPGVITNAGNIFSDGVSADVTPLLLWSSQRFIES